MSKRNLFVGAVVMVTLFATFLFLQRGKKTKVTPSEREVVAPLEVGPLADLERIVLFPAKAPHPLEDGSVIKDQAPPPEKIIWEKRDGVWWITSPIQGRLKKSYQDELAKLFAARVGSDDMRTSPRQAPSLWLSSELFTRAQFFTAGSAEEDKPVLSLLVGKQIGVPGTKLQRTFVKEEGSEHIHRLHAALGFLTRRDPRVMRSDWIIERTNSFPHQFDYTFETTPTRRFVYDGERWGEEGSARRIDQVNAQQVAGLLGGLQAIAVLDGREPKSLGFVAPGIKLEAEGISLTVWRDGSRYFATRAGDALVYELPPKRGSQLLLSPGDFKSRVVRPIEPGALTEVRFLGEDGVVLARQGEGWKMTAPDRRDDVSGPALEGLLDMVATMRALRYVAPALEAQALTEALASERLVFITQDGQKHTLLIGGEAPDAVGDAPDRFARFADEDGVVFVLQGALLHNLTLKAAEFNPASQPLPTQ
jgi:hypothetical protein